jgi:8-oxo-dGTP diphosphatase
MAPATATVIMNAAAARRQAGLALSLAPPDEVIAMPKLKGKVHCYEYPRPAVTIDTVAFAVRDGRLHVLMIRRRNDPFAGSWALPGGFLDIDEPVEHGARRELFEETGLRAPRWAFEPIGFFGAPGRDPRGRTVSLVYATVFPQPAPEPFGADDADLAAWLAVDSVADLAFDHADILKLGLRWLGDRVRNGAVGLAMLPEAFTDDDVKALYEACFGSTKSAVTWRKQLQERGVIEHLDTWPITYRIVEGAIKKREC